MSHRVCGLLSLAFLTLLTGCYTAPAVNAPPAGRVASQTLPTGMKVLVLPARISIVTATTEAPASIANFSEPVADRTLRDLGKASLLAKSSSVVDVDELAGDSRSKAAQAVDELRPDWTVLTSYFKDRAKFAPQFAKLREASGADAAWVCKFTATVGAAGYWDPNSGAIAQTTSSTAMLVMLVSLNTGETLWANEVYSRDLASDSKVRELSELIYRDKK